MYGRSDVKVKVERGSTFTIYARLFIYRSLTIYLFIYRLYLMYAHKAVKVYVCTHVKITRQWKST